MSEREKALGEALAACLQFLVAEQGWESFRADRLYPDHDKKKTCSQENARILTNFLAQPEIKQYIKEFLP